jgi:Rps23 Pro-64 3,4-dihydroxylase Tpa1-like proline 4-hydroxylase
MERTTTRAHAIFDDFLLPQEHLNLWDGFRETALSPKDAGEWNRVYQLTDGEDPVSSASRKLSLRDGTAGKSKAPPSLRLFSEKLFALMTGDRQPISFGPWTGFSLSAWTYRPGMGLEWHSDTGWLAGYIYYAHPVWRSSWGGELLVAEDDESASGIAARSDDPRGAVETVCRTGGAFVYPQPNRLVLLRGGALHCIKKVESAAGQAFRASISGFFFNAGGTPG